MDLIQFQQNLLNIDIWELLRPILQDHFADIEELNRKQLSEGEKADNSAMPDYKSNVYADFKERFVPTYQIYPTTDLRYTGDFYKAIKAQFSTYGISIESFDGKAAELEAKYGSGIYGLTTESLELFTKKLIDPLIKSIHDAIFKN